MKRHLGSISPSGEASTFSRESWLGYLATASDLSRPKPRVGRNPFTGEAVTFQPDVDTAHFAPDGQHLASFGWSETDEASIYVAFDEPHVRAAVGRAREIAEAMDAIFTYEEVPR